jgi:hypothetical protein
VPPGQVAGLAHDAGDEIGIQQEVLAQAALGIEPVPGDDLAQRRQRRAQERRSITARR